MNVSIVVPAYNECDNVEPLCRNLTKSMEVGGGIINDYEIVFVDDGSTDSTHFKLNSLPGNKVKVVRLPKHAGKSSALYAGFRQAINEVIVTIDADLQYDPRDIAGMAEKIMAGDDSICGWRHVRRDPLLKKVSAGIANFARRVVLKDNFHDIGCALRVFKRGCIENIEWFDGVHRFLPALIQMQGFQVSEYKVNHFPRKAGRSKYNIRNRAAKTALNLLHVMKVKKQQKKPQ